MHHGASVKGDVHFYVLCKSGEACQAKQTTEPYPIVILNMFYSKANIACKQDLYEDMIVHEFTCMILFTYNKIFVT